MAFSIKRISERLQTQQAAAPAPSAGLTITSTAPRRSTAAAPDNSSLGEASVMLDYGGEGTTLAARKRFRFGSAGGVSI